jgi:peptidoglycan/LPS O-acetylase OafA/YrhL
MWAYAIGAISYSFYLTHFLIGERVMSLGTKFGGGQLYACCLIATALLVSLAVAAIFSRLIERPSIEASRRIRSPPPLPKSRRSIVYRSLLVRA